jgi:23S rRNA (guanine745-N1)-methyltransferase
MLYKAEKFEGFAYDNEGEQMSSFEIYKCPVCDKQLIKKNNSYSCSGKHTYDIAKEGYVNLLLANQMKSKEPGDSKEMMIARSNFLNKGYFEKLADNLNGIILKHFSAVGQNSYVVFDAGCGEGYYTDQFYKGLVKQTETPRIWGMDISKEAVRFAAKRNKNIEFCVGSIFHLPIIDNSIDCGVNIFAPFREEEFQRVLKKNGIVIKVTPGAQHLMGLKSALYDNPYENDDRIPEISILEIVENINLKYEIHIDNSEDIINMLKMTPYFWNTNIGKINDFMENTKELQTELDFVITVLKRRK